MKDPTMEDFASYSEYKRDLLPENWSPENNMNNNQYPRDLLPHGPFEEPEYVSDYTEGFIASVSPAPFLT
jgi:hypothetical protein